MSRYNKHMRVSLDMRGQTITNARIVNSTVNGMKDLPSITTVTDITALTASQLDALRPGDVVVKKSSNSLHTYVVSYKNATKGELSLTYTDHETIEEVYYEKGESGWAYVTTDSVTPGGN